jgi:hypothetical protein
MPTYVAPTNDNDRSGFLKAAVSASTNDEAAGNTYILPATREALGSFYPEFEHKTATINQKLQVRSKESAESGEAMRMLGVCIRDFWEVARRQTARLNLPARTLLAYGLPLDGVTPNPTTPLAWLSVGRTVVEGAKAIEEQGLPPVTCPSADEVAQALESAVKEHADVSAADRAYDDAQAEMAQARAEADDLIAQIMAELRLTLRKLDSASQRRIMRTYGARFKYLPGEPVDDGDTAPLTESPDEATA